MPYVLKNFDEKWAYDVNKNLYKGKELFDEEAIDQSLEAIIGTNSGERLFNREFGSNLFLYLFESLDENTAEKILENIIASIRVWEDRITVDENNCSMEILYDDNSIILTIPYRIKRTGQYNVYKKKLTQ